VIREAKFSDGRTLQIETPSPLAKEVNRLAYYSSKAAEHHKHMKAAADAASERRKVIAELLRAAGITQCWHEGTLYRLSSVIDVVSEDCPEACDVVAKPEFTDDEFAESAYVQALIDTFQPDRIDEEVA
jgi:hypothetical protein